MINDTLLRAFFNTLVMVNIVILSTNEIKSNEVAEIPIPIVHEPWNQVLLEKQSTIWCYHDF